MLEDTSNIEISFLNLGLNASYSDIGGSLNAFIVKSIAINGLLKIGTSLATANSWDVNTNNIIDATHSAYWTPAPNEYGSINAFKYVARNNSMVISNIQADFSVNVTAKNDLPTLATVLPIVLPSINSPRSIYEDSSNIELSFVQLCLDASYSDIDGSVNAFIVTSVTNNGSLKIGSTTTPWIDGSNCTIDASHSAYWTPKPSTFGLLNAFKIAARDNSMGQSTAQFDVNINVKQANRAPIITPETSTLTGTVSDSSPNATGTMTATDVDTSINLLSWDISGNGVSNYGKMSISSVTNTCTWSYDLSNNSVFVHSLSQGQTVTDKFYVRVWDDLSANATQLVTITITGKNDPVRLLNKIPNQSIDMSSNFSYVIPSNTFLDLDVSDNLIYSVVYTPIPSWLQFESSTRTFTSVSNRTTVGPLTIKVTATDRYTSSSAYFIINVINQQAISGSVLDGYIQGGTITVRDLSTNIVVGGPILSDQSGKFSIQMILQPSTSYIIDCSGGTDMATGAPILYPLSSIYTSGSSSNIMLNSSNVVINPLTTIVSDIVKSNISLYRNNISDVYTHVANAFGLQPSDIGSDYIYSHNIVTGIAAIKIATITKILSLFTSTDINTIKLKIATNIADQTVKLLFDTSFISDTGFGGSSLILKSNLTDIVAAISTLMDAVINFGSATDINRITKQYKELYKLSKGALSISFNNINTIYNG
jgi:VCBS repeat-containing protein